MASKAAKMAVRGNMHIDPRVVEVAHFKSKVRMGIHHIISLLRNLSTLGFGDISPLFQFLPNKTI